mmetsp:Transcript_62947/g.99888  ORF Transcript_62947/g.99888 Transcript_62947/m.99888 type:complete len:215 (-) Transcript_62947:39-683(-)
MTAGEQLAEQLVEAISPYEDVRGYLQQTVLPTMGIAIEDLLHHVHASGELQRVLRKDTDEKRSAPRRIEEIPEEQEVVKKTSSRKPSLNGGGSSMSLGKEDGTSSMGMASASMSATLGRRPSNVSEPVPPVIPESPEEVKFDPLIWLSERFKKDATQDQSQFRAKIKERVLLQIKALEAAEEAERARLAEAEAAARADEEGITSIAEAPEDGGS